MKQYNVKFNILELIAVITGFALTITTSVYLFMTLILPVEPWILLYRFNDFGEGSIELILFTISSVFLAYLFSKMAFEVGKELKK